MRKTMTMMGLAEQMWLTRVSSRPTSPLADLLSHQYGQHWIQEQLTRSSTRAPPRVSWVRGQTMHSVCESPRVCVCVCVCRRPSAVFQTPGPAC